MSKIRKISTAQWMLAGAVGLALFSSAALAASSGYHVARTIMLGGEGGFDYLNIDPSSGYLYITRGSHLMIVDIDGGKVVRDIKGLAGIHGTAFADGKVYVSEGGANKVTVLDGASFAKLSEIPVGMNPDGILYDGFTKRIFTFNGRSSDATAIDTTTGKVVGTVALAGKPEAGSSDGKGTIFVNIETRNEIVAFDARTMAVKAHYALTPCEAPTGQAADLAHNRLFSVCDDGVMAVTDMKTGKLVTTVKIGDGPDAARFDPATGLVFTSNGASGSMTIIHEDTPDKYTVLDDIPTTANARTMELDLKTHRAFVAAPVIRAGMATAENPHPRAMVVPDSFRLLVLSR